MRTLLLGSGARAHALAERIVASGGEVWAIPAIELWESDPCIHAGPADAPLDDVAAWAVEAGIELVVGMDEQSAFADAQAAFQTGQLTYFGPSRAAAVLERSKLLARSVLEAEGLEVPELIRVITDPADVALPNSFPVVLRLDRSASARGVRVVRDPADFAASVGSLVEEHAASGSDGPLAILVEEFVDGFEVTFAVLAGSQQVVDLPPVRDYKHADVGDRGPLTSGMGGYSPVPSLPPGAEAFASGLFRRVLSQMARSGVDYIGYLNANAIYADGRWVVLELNCHMGDPDLELLLPQMTGDIASLLHDLARGRRVPDDVVQPLPSVAISLVQRGYPARAERPAGVIATPGARPGGLYLYTVRRSAHRLLPLGGRVMLVRGTAPSFPQAVEDARRAAEAAHAANPTLVYRQDVGLETIS